MKHYYFFTMNRASDSGQDGGKKSSKGMKKTFCYVALTLAVILPVFSFSQNNPQALFNAAYWNAFADKKQLTPAEKQEFMTSQYSRHVADSLAFLQPPLPAAKPINNGNTIFNGPCVNADFEAGNTSGWTLSSGFHPGYNALGCCPNPGGQQTIMTGAGNDPYGNFPVVYPGGSFSLRLGNDQVNGQADRIEQTFQVSASNANFSYKYAVVFEDPNHQPNEQPFFEVEMLDVNGANVPCTHYFVSSGAGIPGFFNSSTSGVIYKPWSTVLVDLTPFIGQNITIRFSTYDCSLGGHFGYAYIDGVCQSFTGGGASTVCVGASTTFCAPDGVASYTWNGPGVSNVTGQCTSVNTAGVFTVTTTLFTGCPGPSFTYTLVNQVPPIANAGPATSSVCANNSTVSLSGSITAYPATPVWSTSGTGVFSSTTSLSPSYVPSAADRAAGSVTLTLSTASNGACPSSNDNIVISITPSPSVNAGADGATCNANPFTLNGGVSAGASTGTWSTAGNGVFNPGNSVLNASYTPGPADISAGSVSLTLTSTNNGNCLAVSDVVVVTIQQPATIVTAANQTLCSTAQTIAVAAIVSSGAGVWTSSGTGAFAPSNASLNAAYSITPADVTTGMVVFTVTSGNNGVCNASTATLSARVVAPSLVNAGPNQFLCSSSGSINLTGSVTGYSNTGIWTSNGGGSYNPAASTLSTSYLLTQGDITGGSLVFTLTSTNNGPCAAVSDTVRMNIRTPAIVNAGLNQSLCSTIPNISLSGSVGGGGSTGVWASNGVGAINPALTALSSTYMITPADIAAGSVIFTLTSTNNGPCAAVQDSVKMSVVSLATVNAGSNQFICSSAGVVSLGGAIISPSNTGQWTTTGTGLFSPAASSLNTTYSLTIPDMITGSVIFSLSSTNNGPCPVVTDSVMITIKRLAILSAGSAQNICSNQPAISLNGTTAGGATTTTWTASGSGVFSPSAASLATVYSVTPQDIATGNVIFTLTSTNNGPCPAVSNTMVAMITNMATVSAGPNFYVCSNAGQLNLNGSVNSPSNSVQWTGNGSGSFVPNSTTAATAYSFSAADITAGFVTFTVTSTQNGVCAAVSDTVRMRIMRLSQVSAGAGQALCATQGTINLNGSVVGGGNTGIWTSSGNGSFNSNTSLITSYVMSPQDINNGGVSFTLTSLNSAPCPEVSNTSSVSILTQAVVVAGPSQTVCSGNGVVNLSGSTSGGVGTVLWTASGTGNFVPGNTNPVTSYSISAGDVILGGVTLTLSSTNNGACAVSNSILQVMINQLANVNAGPDKAVCSNQTPVSLPGIITGVTTTGQWSGNGSGIFLSNAAAGNYSPSVGDISQGTVIFVLSSTNNGVCPTVNDTMRLTIETKPEISVKPDTSVCDKYTLIALSFTSSTGTGIQWTSSGSGVFLPNNAPSATHYSLSTADKTTGFVNLMLGTSSTGACGYTGATMKVNVLRGPKADFSASAYVLQNPGDQIQFTNATTAADTYTWTFGDGSTSGQLDPAHIFTEVGYYQVTLLARNSNGCTDIIDKTITVISDVQFANAFTPNPNGSNGGSYDKNDYSNDVFFPFARGVVEYDMMIFNRWGELIFRSNDINVGWDGYFNGKLCQQDTYVWKVNMGFFDGRKYNGTGSVTLLK